jgi:hypothetical protein
LISFAANAKPSSFSWMLRRDWAATVQIEKMETAIAIE